MAEVTNPEDVGKKFVKIICRCIYLFGLGDCWYEPMDPTIFTKYLYPIWCVISIGYGLAILVSECLAFLRDDLTESERNDNTMLCIGHTGVMLKFLVLHYKRQKVKDFWQLFFNGTDVTLVVKTEAAAVKKAKVFIGSYGGLLANSMVLITIDAFVRHYNEGTPMRTVTTYWPRNDDTGTLVNICRFFVQFQWWWLLTGQLALDAVCLIGMIFLEYRFHTLGLYFEQLRSIFADDGKTRGEMEEEYKKKFLIGVKLHSDTLQCVRHLQYSLGTITSIHVVEVTSMNTVCLIRLVTNPRSFSFLVACGTTIMALLISTGIYMVAAGDMTYQASFLSAAIFHSGWELSHERAKLRAYLLVSIQCSQNPVTLSAFGIFELSHANFIKILRMSYSFFTLTY